jgi:hypothetical protein
MSMPPQSGWPPSQPGPPYGSQSGYGPQPGMWPPAPPPQKGGGLEWLLISIAVLLVIGVTIGGTLLFTRGGGGGGTTSASGAPSDVASANDTGPVAILTDEPTCRTIFGIADVQDKGWGDQRSTLRPPPTWTSDQRAQVQAVMKATLNVAEQVTGLAKQTPHRVGRELYKQFIAYGRAYADAVPN